MKSVKMLNLWTETLPSRLTQPSGVSSRRQCQLVANGNGKRLHHADRSLSGEAAGDGGDDRNGDSARERKLLGRIPGAAVRGVCGAGERPP